MEHTLKSGAAAKRLVANSRLSSAAQKPDLQNQRRVLEEFVVARGLANVEFVDEIGGGLHSQRKRFLELTDAIGRREVRTLDSGAPRPANTVWLCMV